MSAFKDSGPAIFNNGWNIIPLKEGKNPKFGSWQQWCEKTLPKSQFDIWLAEDAVLDKFGIGLTLGMANNLVAVDIDIWNEDLVLEFIKELPFSPIIKAGAKGATLFYKFSEGNYSQTTNVYDFNLLDGLKPDDEDYDKTKKFGVDFLCGGRQTVLPPTIHPDIKEPYFYFDGSFSFEEIKKDNFDFFGFERISFHEVNAIFERIMERYYGDELANLKSVRKTFGSGGRNDTMVRFVMASFHKYDLAKLIKESIKFDKELHDKPLFSDASEFSGSDSASENATKFVCSVLKSYCRYRADWVHKANKYKYFEDLHEDAFFKYKTKHNGFYFREYDDAGAIKKTSPDYNALSKFFKEECYVKTNESFIYQWKENYYQKMDKLELEGKIKKVTLDQALISSHVSNFRENIMRDCYKPFDYFSSPADYINMKNGVYSVNDNKIYSHSPNLFFDYKLDHEFDSDAKCREWLGFLDRVLGDEDLIKLAQEFLGYCLVNDVSYHKAFVLKGFGRNGKSTFINMIELLLGRKNCAYVPLENFNNGAEVDMLFGKKINLISDDDEDIILPSGTFKKAVGGEYLVANPKYFKPYDLKCEFKLVFACNNMPKFKDKTDGLYEKFIILPFNKYIKPEDRNPRFFPECLVPEASGVFNWAVEGLKRLRLNGKFSASSKSEDAVTAYRNEEDTVYLFFKRCMAEDDDSIGIEYRIKSELYDKYKQFCNLENIEHPVQRKSFGRRISGLVRSQFDESRLVEDSSNGNKIRGVKVKVK